MSRAVLAVLAVLAGLAVLAAYVAGTATAPHADRVTVCHTRAQTHCLWVDGSAHWQ
jgi:hypothetical protein